MFKGLFRMNQYIAFYFVKYPNIEPEEKNDL